MITIFGVCQLSQTRVQHIFDYDDLNHYKYRKPTANE